MLTAWAVTASFLTYFFMFAFRKPFAAGTYEGIVLFGWGVEAKTVFVISQIVGTAVFAIYVCDAIGYTGSVALQLYKDLFHASATRLEFLANFGYVMAIGGTVLLAISYVDFARASAPDP